MMDELDMATIRLRKAVHDIDDRPEDSGSPEILTLILLRDIRSLLLGIAALLIADVGTEVSELS